LIDHNEKHAGCTLEGAWSGSTDVAGRSVALVLHVALVNLFNRVNVSTRQPAGDW